MPNLIGSSFDQVPTNGMLGGLAYQSPENATIRNLELTNLSGHNSLITGTAVDVFVYDTRKDSDGGAWRKRTQHTSWYNETLNTPTRGSRRDFPAVAVIVATTTSVTIYDGDDPDMPMWMGFTNSGAVVLNWATNGPCTPSSIFCINGILSIGKTVSGCLLFNFVKDDIRLAYPASPYSLTTGRLITDRNNSNSGGFTTTGDGYIIATNVVNDVAMTVLPNAPIDSATGLPVPTIAVATNSGVSVIKDDGNVWDISPSPTSVVGKVIFDKNKILFASDNTSRYNWIYQFDIPNADSAPSYLINPNSIITNYGHNVDFSTYSAIPLDSEPFTSNNVNNLTVSNNNVFVGTNKKLSQVYFDSSYSPFAALTAQITTSYNTGWQPWNIKGAWLSDTSTASVTGTELNQYGDFSSTTGWGSRTAAWTISGGVATVSSGAGYQLLGNSSGTLTNGRKYSITVNVTAFTAGRLELSQANSGNIPLTLGSTGFKSFIITYTGTTGQSLGFYGYGDASYGFTIDNLYVRELSEADRSVNNNGLAVYGTITKSPVATGSNLVAYSGWSNSNYLRRPEGVTDLNNSSITYMCWYKGGGYNGEEAPVSTGDYNVINQVRGIYINPSGIAGFSGWANDFNPGSFNVRDYVWHHICVTIQYISGTTYTISVYVDGRLTGLTNRELSTFTNTAIDVGGGSLPGTRYTIGSLSLVKVSTTIPSPDQILKIYNDEKALFQPNSQCTLYGSSDAVTALAYDDTTRLLHVGTSSGRSVFQGLERVSNTILPVATAISASNGLVAEQ